MMGIPSTNCYGAACARLYPTRVSAAAQTGSVPPVTPVPAVGAAGRDTNMGCCRTQGAWDCPSPDT